MINEIGISNVRVFSRTRWNFPLSDITVFCGTNSAGKSTILKMIPLLRQSHGIREGGAPTPGQLRFVGSQVDLGNYTSISSNNNNGPIEISITLSHDISIEELEFFNHVSGVKDLVEKYKLKQIESIKAEIYCNFKFIYNKNINKEQGHELSVEDVDFNSSISRFDYLDTANFKVIADGINIFNWDIHCKVTKKKKEYYLLLPKNYFDKIGASSLMEPDSDFPLGKDTSNTVAIYIALRGLLPNSLIAKRKLPARKQTNKKRPQKNKPWGVFPLPPHLESFCDSIFQNLVNFHYIAPLRSAAKRYYVANSDAEPQMDPAGEFLPHFMKNKHHIYQLVSHYSPLPDFVELKESFIDAISKWTNYLTNGQIEGFNAQCRDFHVSTTKEILVELSLKSEKSGEFHSLADSGFGYSQVLPILAVCLLAKKGATIAIEQPELHLNPALQVRLAKFFISMARSGKKLILETHSEHIVNALRVYTAESSEIAEFPSISLKFIEHFEDNLEVHELNVLGNGTVPNWPKHFFGEALDLSGRLLRAQRSIKKIGH